MTLRYLRDTPGSRQHNGGVQIPIWVAYACIVVATCCYGASTLLLSQGSQREVADVEDAPTLGMRVRAVIGNRHYLAGLACQGGGFLLAFVARSSLPLVVAQSFVAASVAVSAVAGSWLGRWRLQSQDLFALAAVVAGIAAICLAAVPATATWSSPLPIVAATLIGLLPLVLLWFPVGGTVLGAAAGVAFGSSAIGARMVAAQPLQMFSDTSVAIATIAVVTGMIAGQILLTVAFQRGGVTGPVSALYVLSTTWPAMFGLQWLNDTLHPGGMPIALAGMIAALIGTSYVAKYENSRDAETDSPAPASD